MHIFFRKITETKLKKTYEDFVKKTNQEIIDLKQQFQYFKNYIELKSWIKTIDDMGEDSSLYKPLMDEIAKHVNNFADLPRPTLTSQYMEVFTQ